MKEINVDNAKKVTIDIVKVNIFCFELLVVSAIVMIVPYCLIWGSELKIGDVVRFFNPFFSNWLIFLAATAVGIVIHELIHGITWACFAPSGWKSISFGIIWKMLTPYCHCNEPMHSRPYITGALMPLIVLGIIPAIICLINGSLFLLVWSIIFIAAAGGDIWMSWLLTKEGPDCTVLDHPSETGFYVFE